MAETAVHVNIRTAMWKDSGSNSASGPIKNTSALEIFKYCAIVSRYSGTQSQKRREVEI
jgi:hypothetical protein